MPKFHPLHPRSSLRRLRTAFGPSATSPSPNSYSSRSPLSTSTRPESNHSGFDFGFGDTSTISLTYDRHTKRAIRKNKSMTEMEFEEERIVFADELVALVEPRPVFVGPSRGGIEEILEGRV